VPENQSIAITCRGVHKHFGDGTRVQASLAALKVEAVADFDERGDEGRFEVRICNVFAGGILAFGRGAEKNCSQAARSLPR
jgi:hypothetical protein